MTDSCMSRTASATKEASGILVYLIEELGDARLRAAQLKQYVAAALELVEKSEKKDHFYEVAADVLHGIPDSLFKLDKALDAAAMAASRMDYEEIKQGLKPEKAEELERVLEDVRLQYLKRRSTPEDKPMSETSKTAAPNAKTAAEMLEQMAVSTDVDGAVPVAKLAGLIAQLEQGQKQAAKKDPAVFFREAAEYLRSTPNPSRRELAATLRRVLADNLDTQAAEETWAGASGDFNPWVKELGGNTTFKSVPVGASFHFPKSDEVLVKVSPTKYQTTDGHKFMTSAGTAVVMVKTASEETWAGAGEDFKKHNPDISDEAVKKIDEMHEKHKDVVKEKGAGLDDASPLGYFDMAFMAAKRALSAANRGNERMAVLLGVETIQSMTSALSGLAPEQADKLAVIAAKTAMLRQALRTEAARTDVLASDDYGLTASEDMWAEEDKAARYEKGKPADPTENMSPEDAAEWEQNTQQYGDKFKSATYARTATQTIKVPGASGRYGYIATYRGRSIEIYADTTLQAQEAAAKFFKARKTYEVDVMLAEKNGKPVVHDPSAL